MTPDLRQAMAPEVIEAGARALFVLDERNGGNTRIAVNDACVNYWFRQGPDATGEDAECYRLCQSYREQAATVAHAIIPLIEAAERERCARIAEDDLPQSDSAHEAVAEAKAGIRIAAAIRSPDIGDGG